MIDELEMLTQLGLSKFLDPIDLGDSVVDRRNNPRLGIDPPWSKLQGGIFQLPAGGVSLLGGFSGHQKSTLANQWLLHAANTGHKVCVASLEMTTESLFEQLAGQSACKHEPHEGYLYRFGRWCQDKIYIIDHHDVLGPEEAIQLVIDSKRLLGCDMFVLDCLFQIDLGGELDVEKRFFQKLAATARDLEMVVLVCHHMRKGQGPDSERRVPGKQDFIGSSHLVNASAACLILWQDKAKAAARNNGEEVDDDQPDFVLEVAKNRFGPYEGRIGLYQHDQARLITNSRARQYRPIIIEEDECQPDERHIGESHLEKELSTFPMRKTPATTQGTEQTIQRTGTEYLSWM